MTKYLLTLLAMLPFSAQAWEYPEFTQELPYEEGMGTQEIPYVIKNAQQLANLAYYVNNGTSFAGQYFKLGSDIDLNPDTSAKKAWIQIGTLKNPFKGNFNGDGFHIKGLYLDNVGILERFYSVESGSVGLFGYVADSSFENVILSDCHIDLKISLEDTPDLDNIEIGNLLGSGSNVSVRDCKVTSEVNVTGFVDNGYIFIGIGGIAGSIDESREVSDCEFYGKIVFDGEECEASIENGIGGIAGTLQASVIKDCINYGDIEVLSGRIYVGGISAAINDNWTSSTISGLVNRGRLCSDKGVAAGLSAYWLQAGGIDDCHNFGEIMSKNRGGCYGLTSDSNFMRMYNCTNNAYVAGVGLIGYGDFLVDVQNCHNYADVKGVGLIAEGGPYDITIKDCTNSGNVSTAGIIGGGMMGATLINCHNSGNVKGEAGLSGFFKNDVTLIDCTNIGDIDGSEHLRSYSWGYYTSYTSEVGGILSGGNNNVSIYNCKNEGKVVGIKKVGGICGYGNILQVEDCENSGEISLISNSEITDKLADTPSCVGGIVGLADLPEAKIVKCKNRGMVIADYSYPDNWNSAFSKTGVGGVVGNFCGEISESDNSGEISVLNDGVAGGVVGCSGSVKMSLCSNIGKIAVENEYCGGLIGFLESSSLRDSYSAAELIAGNGYVGGLVGKMYSTVINDCFSYSVLMGKEKYPLSNYMNDMTWLNGFYYLETEGLSNPEGSLDEGSEEPIAKTIADFSSGRVCLLLNHDREDPTPWGQTVGEDPYPLLNGAGNPDNVDTGVTMLPEEILPDLWTVSRLNGEIVKQMESETISGLLQDLPSGIYIFSSRKNGSFKILCR